MSATPINTKLGGTLPQQAPIVNTPAQLERFKQALANKEITQEQYNYVTGTKPQPTVTWQRTSTTPTSPLPPDPATPTQQGNWVPVSPAPKPNPVVTLAQDFKSLPWYEQLNPINSLSYLTNTNKAISDITGQQGGVNRAVEGMGGTVANQLTGASNFLGNIAGQKPAPTPYTPNTETAKIAGLATQVGEIGLVVLAAPVVLPISAPAVIAMGAVNAGISQGVQYATTGKFGTPTEVLDQALVGSAFAVGGSGLLAGGAKVAGASIPVLSKVATTAIGTTLGRTAMFTAGGAVVGYGTDPTPAGAIGGAVMGGAFALGGEVLGKTMFPKLQQLRGAQQLQEGPLVTTFDNQQVPSYISKPNEALGGKQLQIVSSVTANPVGSKGVTLEGMMAEYSGKSIPTSHATLGTEGFNLGKGETTLLKGFPTQAKGSRADLELYHFYSAPGDAKYVKGYGGYMGIGEGESGSIPQFKTGKPTLLTTLNTKVSPELMQRPNESMGSFLDRFSKSSGKTGLGPETQLGFSQERQLETPASYLRNGEQLQGSLYRSQGKVGTFQIKQYSESNFLGKPIKNIPVLKDLTARSTTFDVYKGEYEAVIGERGVPKVTEVTNRPTKVISGSSTSLPTIPSNPMINSQQKSPSNSSPNSIGLGSKSSQSNNQRTVSNSFLSQPTSRQSSQQRSYSNSEQQLSYPKASDPSYPNTSNPSRIISSSRGNSVENSFLSQPSSTPKSTPNYSPYSSPNQSPYPSILSTPSNNKSKVRSNPSNIFLPNTDPNSMKGKVTPFFGGEGKLSVKRQYDILTAEEFLGKSNRRSNGGFF
jgi:hypothetical protein